jgi:hypothetical protein
VINLAVKVHRSLLAAVDANLGRCSKCIRKSFLSAGLFWVILAAVEIAGTHLPRHLMWLLTILCVTTTALWLAHLLVSAARSTARSSAPQGTAKADQSRRAVFHTFARALGFVAFATALPQWAAAEGCYGRCSSQQSQCLDACGDVSSNTDPQAHRQWGNCTRACHQAHRTCTDACDNPSDDSSGDSDDQPPPKKPKN